MRIIAAQADLDEGCAYLARVCPVWARVLLQLGALPLRRRADGFGAICDAVVGQQISVAAAAAITARMQAAGLLDQAAIAVATEDELRAAGLSRPKARYLKGIAAAGVDWRSLRDLPDDQVMAALVALPGVGRWTAEIYLKFALGRADVIASGDLALQEAARLMYDLAARPTPAALIAMAEPWRPWRAVAARGLWAYYRLAKGREGVT
ncbi:MAG: DNA-3-methyladenine glycosylase 2 family protein [Paracoccus sp. (in: a-proteobacteria)]|uniref:DNA-3-methyladenine glycosylase family protein n=1 Tax=Paracoccus sp. TaxID=267 RepID=UPI0026E06CAE|nr:DNA-3-methyladenine glycosylase 2 family protein [Paracoccus sp. (in: a-proteobacteria)]MDO5613057.1 DNA-3-methyladenine glycosylase 2 family protein [Paracoccus sp. (in: a-proteobacteria)]